MATKNPIQGNQNDNDGEGRLLHANPMKSNTILYGPPGTGKTHSVTALALSVFAAEDQRGQYGAVGILSGKPPANQTKEEWRPWVGQFKEFVKNGRIEVTTFHQNYSYEDFIEGLKASVRENDDDSTSVVYQYESGILKRIAYRALYAWLTGGNPANSEMTREERDFVLCWLKTGELPEGARGRREANTPALPYVLVIDEINRGNVARILGELITLVEESKRARLPEELELGHQPLSATLPYSKEPFILPPNLYIIGTMNTADRSLIGLDAALRRRFDFVEIASHPEIFARMGNNGVVDGVDLVQFLTTLNEKIVDAERTTDHEIGHAYFLGVRNIGDLAAVMSRKVIPQLREYFFDRPGKIVNILAPTRDQGNSAFVDDIGRTKPEGLMNAENYRRLYSQG